MVGEGESNGIAHGKYQLLFLMRAEQLFTSPGNMCHSKFKWGGGRVEGLNVMVGEWESNSIAGDNYLFMFPLKAGLLYTSIGNFFLHQNW
jgi:hypothetical protein